MMLDGGEMVSDEVYAFLVEYGFPAETLEDLREYFESERRRANERFLEQGEPSFRVGTDDFPAVLDQRKIMQGRSRKWYLLAAEERRTGGRRRTKKQGVCCHHSAVHRGFGVHSATVAEVTAGVVPLPKFVEWPLDKPDKAVVNRAVALAARYRGVRGEGVPYHAITSANSVLTLNLDFELVTWHGDGANNDYLGWAWDGHSGRESPPVDSLRADLRRLIAQARCEGHPCTKITAHSVWSRKPTDPGREFVEEVILPVAAEMGCTVDLDEHHGTGRPLREVLAR